MGLCPVYLSLLAVLLAGCAGTQATAPIRERAWVAPAAPATARPAAPTPAGQYRVQPGDTLYKIAFEHSLDPTNLAIWNNLSDPGRIRSGDSLRLTPPAKVAVATRAVPATPGVEAREMAKPKPAVATHALPATPGVESREMAKPVAVKPVAITPVAVAPTPIVPAVEVVPPTAPPARSTEDEDAVPDAWSWPVRGSLLARYGEGLSKGIDIAAPRGALVQAAAPGRVVYAGSGLRGYGKLIIIRHGKTLLSAYAHNARILVTEGQNVTRGQTVGEIGDSDTDRIKLHFEIRERGKPVDPMNFLPNAG